MMGAFVEYAFIGVLWATVMVLLAYVNPLLATAWMLMGLVLFAAHATNLALRVRRQVKQHPDLRWRLP